MIFSVVTHNVLSVVLNLTQLVIDIPTHCTVPTQMTQSKFSTFQHHKNKQEAKLSLG